MHEASLVQAVLTQVATLARERGAARVVRMRIRIGQLAGVEEELFRFAFDALSHSTICADAVLEILPEKVEWTCDACGNPIAAGDRLQCCVCGWPARLVRGDSLLLEQVELETP